MRILVVEDEIKLAKAIKRALELQSYAVDVAEEGEAGFDLASTESYDLIILDVMLPHLNGFEITQKLRHEHIHTPILMLTAKGQTKDKTTGLDAGADDYLVKPFSFEELFSRIRALIRRSANNMQTTLTAGDLELHPTTFKVTRADKNISLSSKEFAILEYLLRHQNQVVSKQQMVDHVWDYDANILPSTIEVHIKNLRDKIDKPFDSNLIRTVRGFGYEIKGDT